MSDWITRLREAAFTSASGTRILFKAWTFERAVTVRGTAFEFPGVDDAYVQQMGNGPRRYPLRCNFSGPNHDLEAAAFVAAILERGTGTLEHPRFGPIKVVAFGDVGSREDLVTEANQTVVEVTFWTTLGAIYPTAEAHPQNEILAQLGNFNVGAAQRYANVMKLNSSLNRAAAKATIRDMLKQVGTALDSVSSSVRSVRRGFAEVEATINQGIDVLIGKPLALAQQISDLIQAPGRALVGIESRLDGYGRMADSIFGSTAANPAERIGSSAGLLTARSRVANDWHTSDLFLLNAVAGSVVTVTAQPIDDAGRVVRAPIFQTRPQAIAAAATIDDLLTRVIEWRDSQLDALAALDAVGTDQFDSGDGYQPLRAAASGAVGRLVQDSFSLTPERSITLARPRTIIDVAAQVYGTVDSRLDFLIETNKLAGSEILELPRGRKIVYYDAA